MPTQTTPLTIAAKSSTLGTGDYIVFTNLTHGTKKKVQCNSKGEAVVDNPPSDWAIGDTILIEVFGKYNSGTTQAIGKGGVQKDLGTLSEDTNTVDVSL